jgi:hypothetical protein
VSGLVPVRSRDLSRAFFVVAALLVPWTLYLALTLPRHYPAHHYWLGWVGFDLALVAVLAVTGLAVAQGRPALSRYAAVAAAMLVMDAWFDVLNAATVTDVWMAVGGALLELPLAYLCWRLARGDSRALEPVAGAGEGRRRGAGRDLGP